jgi:hypothetical protein
MPHAAAWNKKGHGGVEEDGRANNSSKGETAAHNKTLPPDLLAEVQGFMHTICKGHLHTKFIWGIDIDNGRHAHLNEGDRAFTASKQWIRLQLNSLNQSYRRITDSTGKLPADWQFPPIQDRQTFCEVCIQRAYESTRPSLVHQPGRKRARYVRRW